MVTVSVTGSIPATPGGTDWLIQTLTIRVARKGDWSTTVTPLLTILKQTTPTSERTYNPQTKCWELASSAWVKLKPIFEAYPNVRVSINAAPTSKAEEKVHVSTEYAESFYQNNAGVSSSSTIPRETILESLNKLLETDVSALTDTELKRAYRRKALELHPDRNNGDGARMSELNMNYSLFITK